MKKKRLNQNSKLILGTAQFGLNYGVSNKGGVPDDSAINAIIEFAKTKGIHKFDTASSYGEAEERIGKEFKKHRFTPYVTTKIKINPNLSKEDMKEDIRFKIKQSLSKLEIETLTSVLIHNFDECIFDLDNIISSLYETVKEGLVKEIGASVYTPDEAMACLHNNKVKVIQLPFNILDWRWFDKKFIELIGSRKDVEIQVRSIFLQGLLLNSSEIWPNEEEGKKYADKLDKIMRKLKIRSRLELCIAYVKSIDWISSFVIGVDDMNHLIEINNLNTKKVFSDVELDFIFEELEKAPIKLLDPRCWHE